MIDLLQPRERNGWKPDFAEYTELRKCLPFYKSHQGEYTHRVRAGTVHWWSGSYHHTSLQLWCGMGGFIGRGELMHAPAVNATMCATCEGRAIGAGMTETHQIAGRFVKFSPRL
jgi:hypothetical protein